MRHKPGDEIFVTDGRGHIYKTEITTVSAKDLTCRILQRMEYPNRFSGITFCIPRLKSPERLEFALEKSVELGVTNFIVYQSKRTIAQGERLDRWQKVFVSAMKQSLRAWLPKVEYMKNLASILNLEGKKILFDQNAEQSFKDWINLNAQSLLTNDHYFIFGPEGGFDKDELRIANCELRIRLTENRLRSETAAVTAASILAMQI